jgi:hypothetical protein
VLCLVRSMKNHFAPINKIPPELLSLIPKYLGKDDMDKSLIALTHACRSWRELLIGYPSLWARLDCANADKTRVYIERAKLSPLEIALRKRRVTTYLEGAFPLVIPHIGRLRSLSIVGTRGPLPNLTQHLSCPIPFLRNLTINLTCHPPPVLDSALFNGNLSSLHTLSLTGVITHLPWKDLSKLTAFELGHVPEDTISITRLLNFFANAPHLTDITLHHSIPTSSNAPPERVVSLSYLKNLAISADPTHSILLNHLSIPAGASLVLNFGFLGNKSPLPDYLPTTPKNLKNLASITSANLYFSNMEWRVRLKGPSGGLLTISHWRGLGATSTFSLDRRILRSLDYFVLSKVQRLGVTKYKSPTTMEPDKSPPYHILHRMKDLRTLTLIQCKNLPFILALDPDQIPSKPVPCPKLEELVLYVESRDTFNIPELMSMAKERASGGAKLSSITIIGLGELVPGKEVFKLRAHVAHVDYRVGEQPPNWDDIAD